jgi:hypothetical protein
MKDELLKWEIFKTLEEFKALIEYRGKEYNQIRFHISKNCRSLAPETILTELST